MNLNTICFIILCTVSCSSLPGTTVRRRQAVIPARPGTASLASTVTTFVPLTTPPSSTSVVW